MHVVELITIDGNSRKTFDRDTITFGRSPDCDVVLKDEMASRVHCEILRRGDRYLLKDSGSRNGTLVLGRPIKAVKLRDTGIFQIGHTFIRFFTSESSAALAPPARHPRICDEDHPTANSAPSALPDVSDLAKLSEALSPSDMDPGTGIVALAEQNQPHVDAADDSGEIQLVDADDSSEDSESLPDLESDQLLELNFESESDAKKSAGKPAGRERGGGGVTNLKRLGSLGQDIDISISDLSMINARGQTLHAAGKQSETGTKTLRLLQLVLLGAVRCRASDIHIEPHQDTTVLRMRIDGAMMDGGTLQADDARRFTSMVKVLSDIDITQKSSSQEGRFSMDVPGRTIDYRVSFAPAMHGQKLVLRVLDPEQSPQKLEQLDLPETILKYLRRASTRSQGVMMVCGPTGSGKTTTLYATLRNLDESKRNIMTIEDPIEYELDGVTQLPVHAERGDDYPTLLRSCLRQDPDVIVVGEIRDSETAVTAMEAATTGHLVFSSLHATDAVGTVLRLLDLGVEPYLLASTLNIVLAQRLVRRLCTQCRLTYTVDPDTAELLGREGQSVEIYKPQGCQACSATGYHGRVGIFELLQMNDALRDQIMNQPTLVQMRQLMEDVGSMTLKQHAIERVLDGDTSLQEADQAVNLLG
jgi:type II secretory ATPase GspE/PulE/Tfp pilus assembly ATPase PilB-like protein